MEEGEIERYQRTRSATGSDARVDLLGGSRCVRSWRCGSIGDTHFVEVCGVEQVVVAVV